MTGNVIQRKVPDDWYRGEIPANVEFGDGLWLETAQVFRFCRSQRAPAVRIGNWCSIFAGCSFAVKGNGFCSVGDHTLLNGALIMCEQEVTIGTHCLISWNVGIADSDFHPLDPVARRRDAELMNPYFAKGDRPPIPTRPVRIGNNVWIGMGAIVLKGVTIGDDSVIGAGAVVSRDVPAGVVVAGNPARVVKKLAVSSRAPPPRACV